MQEQQCLDIYRCVSYVIYWYIGRVSLYSYSQLDALVYWVWFSDFVYVVRLLQ